MTPARVLSFGSLPPEWGGPSRGGVASVHASLNESLAAGSGMPAEVVGAVPRVAPNRPTPVQCRVPAPGQTRTAFLEEVVAQLEPDVILQHHFATAWGLLLPDALPHLPLVGIAHSWHTITLRDDPVERSEAIDRVQRAMDALAVLIVPTEYTRREGLALGLRYPADTRVIPYAVRRLFAAPLDVTGPRGGVVFVGNLEPRKNAAALIGAVALLPDVRLTIVGSGPEEQALRGLAGNLGLGGRVRFDRGPDDGNDEWLRDIVASAEVLCVPSLSESFGLVYTEALACGTPVVGFPGTLREIADTIGVEVGVGLWGSARESIAAAIEQVRCRQWDRELLRSATIRAYPDRAIARRYADALAEAAARPPALVPTAG